ncbi:ribosome biogenesis protein NOP53-like [Amphiura filiformis]|uniref:ribosome biogenesis protein NOP53-like n=1 Tax=Amphiura filiformis TaxID=82378 RepID=UPI003B21353C
MDSSDSYGLGVVTRVSKKKKVSKNKKKNWRKHTDIKDVEEFLEDQRLQLRTGGIVADKPDESLFFEDKKQDAEDKGRRKKKKIRPIYPNLEPDPNIKPVPKPIPYNPNKATGNKKLKQKVRELNQLEKLGIFTPGRLDKLQVSLRQSARHREEKDKEKASRESGTAEYDLWGDSADPVSKAYGKKKVDEGASEHYLRVTKKVPKKLPIQYFDKPTKVPAVEVEAPGASYNPSFEDHQELILATYKVEAEKEKKEEKLTRWHSNIKKLSARELEKAYMQEMSAGIFNKADESAEAGDGTTIEEDITPNPPVVPDARKTRKQRRKEKEEKIKSQKLSTDKTDRIRMNEVYRLRGIKRELTKGEEESEKNKKARVEKRAAEAGMPKQVGKHRVEEPDLAIKLSDELCGSLRELKPEGDLLIDRYKHFQKRNFIEARISVKGKKQKMKEYTRKSHKDELQTLPFRNAKRNARKLLK